MDKIKIGMIGAGGRAQTHYASLAEMSDVNMTAICDLNEERMISTAEKYGINGRYTDYKLMLKKIDLDAVYIIMQPTSLDPLVTFSLKQGKNVFIEKPPGTDAKETLKWAKLAKKNNCKTAVGFQRRFHPCVVEAKKIVEERGRILYCMTAFHKYGEWKGEYDSLIHDVIHIVDLLRWIGGEVKKVRSLNGQLYNNTEDYLNFYTALLEFESGGVGILTSNRTAGGRVLYFEMYSKGISAYGDIPGIHGIDYYKILKDNQPYQEAKIVKNEEIIGNDAPQTHIDGSFQINRNFIDCIKSDRQPITNFKDATKTMKVIKEIHSSPHLPSVM